MDRHSDLTLSYDGVGAEFAMIGGKEMFAMKLKEIGDLAVD